MIRARLVHDCFAPEGALRDFLAAIGPDTGGVVSFVGLARGTDKAGKAVASLHLDHHPRLTERSLADIAAAGAERFPVSAVDVIHRAGAIFPGEAIVWVAAAAPHRRSAFEAADYLMDRLKTEAVFWKREEGPAGALWIEPTAADRRERARWE